MIEDFCMHQVRRLWLFKPESLTETGLASDGEYVDGTVTVRQAHHIPARLSFEQTTV